MDLSNSLPEYLRELEQESIHVLRVALSEFRNPVILFSGGKDSIVTSYLARKALLPLKMQFPLLHIDTGHNFQETLDFRDQWAENLGSRLIIRSVQDSIDQGRVKEETGPLASRNVLQTVTLMDAIRELDVDCAIGGARRDEEKARAKERFFSHRNKEGQWQPQFQRPELWNILNGRHHTGEHFRVFPISNWTELDVWMYIYYEKIDLPSLYYSHERECLDRNGVLLASTPHISLQKGESTKKMTIRFRTIGDMTCTGATISTACNIEEVIDELFRSRTTERSTRADDQRSDAAMEERKIQGYF